MNPLYDTEYGYCDVSRLSQESKPSENLAEKEDLKENIIISSFSGKTTIVRSEKRDSDAESEEESSSSSSEEDSSLLPSPSFVSKPVTPPKKEPSSEEEEAEAEDSSSSSENMEPARPPLVVKPVMQPSPLQAKQVEESEESSSSESETEEESPMFNNFAKQIPTPSKLTVEIKKSNEPTAVERHNITIERKYEEDFESSDEETIIKKSESIKFYNNPNQNERQLPSYKTEIQEAKQLYADEEDIKLPAHLSLSETNDAVIHTTTVHNHLVTQVCGTSGKNLKKKQRGSQRTKSGEGAMRSRSPTTSNSRRPQTAKDDRTSPIRRSLSPTKKLSFDAWLIEKDRQIRREKDEDRRHQEEIQHRFRPVTRTENEEAFRRWVRAKNEQKRAEEEAAERLHREFQRYMRAIKRAQNRRNCMMLANLAFPPCC